MKTLKVLFIALLFSYVGTSFASENVVAWGGLGGDKPNGTRFSAQKSERPGVDAIEITCDLGDENAGILEIHLVDANGVEAVGSECWATERHITAPVACVVSSVDVMALSGEGRIIIADRNKALISEDVADLDAIKGILN